MKFPKGSLKGKAKTGLSVNIQESTAEALNFFMSNCLEGTASREYIIDYALRQFLERANPLILEYRKEFIENPVKPKLNKKPKLKTKLPKK